MADTNVNIEKKESYADKLKHGLANEKEELKEEAIEAKEKAKEAKEAALWKEKHMEEKKPTK